MSAPTSSAMPAFSYAQAARGLAPSKDKESSTEQSPRLESKSDTPATQPAARNSRSRGPAEDKDNEGIAKEAPSVLPTADEIAEKENLPPNNSTQPKSDGIPSSVASPNITGVHSSPKEKDLPQRLDRTDSWDKDSHNSMRLEEDGVSTVKEKAKESEDDWEKVSVPSISGDKEKLKPAPVPTVNPWTIRQQARDHATPRPAPATAQPANGGAGKPKPFVEGAKNKSTPKEPLGKEGSSARKSADTTRGNERSGTTAPQLSRPQSQHDDKPEVAAAPAVGDVAFWPTPETATTDERRKSSVQDKIEARPNGSKSHGKQWVTMPFVPTAKFETQLPASAARRGARSGRARGDGPSRGGYSHTANTGDKQDASNAMPPPPLPRQSGDPDRGRKSEGGRGGRSSSLPTNNRRATSRESTMTSARKPAGQVRPANAGPDTDPPPAQRTANYESHTPSRSSSRHERTATRVNGDLSASQVESNTDPFTASNQDLTSRSSQPDRSKPIYSKGGDAARERGLPRNRDWSREKSDAAREKVESWRDREYSGETGYRREPRSERGRGSYRGRGNHASSYQNSHAYTAPLPQNGFENPRPTNSTEARSRQSSQPHPMGGQLPANRNNPRSQSIPIGMMYPPFYNNVPGVQQAMSPLQTDVPAYGYPPQMQMPGIMSAMPYNDPLSSYAVLSMVVTQVEYYFSIDNLCKDLYLRKNMDSQGWVPLSVIATFKRIKTLTDDALSFDTLRSICQSVKGVEYLHGEDGEDRLRRRDGWQDFVLEMHERFPAAQNDGPTINAPTSSQQMPIVPLTTPGESIPFFPQQMRSPPSAAPTLNGGYNLASAHLYAPASSVDGYHGEIGVHGPFVPTRDQSRRESATSPLSQAEIGGRPAIPFASNPRSPTGAANGHRRQISRTFNEENNFPDDAIASINICIREPLPDTSVEEQVPSPSMSRVLSNESSNADVPAVSIPPRVSGLRGGAGSPEQLARLQSMMFGFTTLQASAAEAPAFYTKEGEQTQMPPVKPGQYFVTYQALHDSSLQQREQGVQGAMKLMYSFWANFLVDKFNEGMYSEFKSLADSDARAGDTVGLQHLVSYYQSALKTSAPLSERAASDMVALLRGESDSTRAVFKMMRLAWRDGSLSLKTRKRIGDLLSDEEKTEFDRGG